MQLAKIDLFRRLNTPVILIVFLLNFHGYEIASIYFERDHFVVGRNATLELFRKKKRGWVIKNYLQTVYQRHTKTPTSDFVA